MNWSHSHAAAFRQCPRRWYLKSRFKNARANDPDRREAWVLANLTSIYAWRGTVFHDVVGSTLIAALNRGQVPGLAKILAVARNRFDAQAAFAAAHRVREPGMSASHRDFAAWFDQEYGDGVPEETIAQAWEDIENSFTTLYSETFSPLRELIKSANARVAERFLKFSFAGVSIFAVPDLILFFDDAPPVIVDWKVQQFAFGDARDQLATYALALSTVKPHRDFPPYAAELDPTSIKLIEAQLLTGDERSYGIDNDDLLKLEDTITTSVFAMQAAMAGEELPPPTSLPPAHYGSTCTRCSFKRMCWSTPDEDD